MLEKSAPLRINDFFKLHLACEGVQGAVGDTEKVPSIDVTAPLNLTRQDGVSAIDVRIQTSNDILQIDRTLFRRSLKRPQPFEERWLPCYCFPVESISAIKK